MYMCMHVIHNLLYCFGEECPISCTLSYKIQEVIFVHTHRALAEIHIEHGCEGCGNQSREGKRSLESESEVPPAPETPPRVLICGTRH